MTSTRTDLLRALHQPGDPLILPNVWDVGSATIVAEAGYPALATASASIAAMLGYDDHEGAPVDEMLDIAAKIIRAVDVPVTVDAEAGYGLPPAELVERLTAIGAAGFNIEELDHRAGSLLDVDTQAARIAALRAASRDLVINARVDLFLVGSPSVEEVAERARRYLEAGADCVFPMLAPSEDVIGELVQAIPGPVNVTCLPGMNLSRLAALGVARVSFGPMTYLAALDALKAMSNRILSAQDPYGT
ncbi:isocitrate lyase/PEP mutase family protein [Nonomuraea gerenzanensis]|uniref:Probable carboxyvinyl-carboxyphosphonate phosphorylmutase n=1 Tax=Nonomuraea gerenzanensis TaxID=93944 RepID=A0A1M4DX85_9ACTN|nr:isocitrate lyase/phosphoenolpyruvate mutase family protein [Nonomuraea gerenzanensis]UBU13529.1 isocitrate lyase/phosphoenolpyruvate mutase family protein [Nonomuraea gerenzanensis]SBO91193.1 Probable carboxyvinyl-carboxyphosphonate phosphorylmutase [Nonomuraea gerenzanensis]